MALRTGSDVWWAAVFARVLYIAPWAAASACAAALSVYLEGESFVLKTWVRPSAEPFLDSAILGQLSFVMSFLLLFRSGQAYDRWASSKRDLGDMRQGALQFNRHLELHSGDTSALRAHLSLLFSTACGTISKTEAMRISPRASRAEALELAHALDPLDCVTLASGWLTRDVRIACENKLISKENAVLLDADIGRICDAFARAYTTSTGSIPLAYTAMARVIAYGFTILMPLTIGPSYGLAAPLVAAVYSACLIGLDRVASEMEHPFCGGDINDHDVRSYADSVYHAVDSISK